MCRSTSNFSDDKFQQTTSYGSILYQLREVHDESTDICDFLQRVFEVTWDSCECCGIIIYSVVIATLSLGMGWYGWVDIFKCWVGWRLYQMREVHDESTDICDFLQRVFEVSWDSCE